MHQPLAGKVGRRGYSQHARLLQLQHPMGADRQAVEGIAHHLEVAASRIGDDETLALAIEQSQASSASSAFTWWLTAPCVTDSSSAALVKLSCRAAASKAFRALSEGSRRSIASPPAEKNWAKQ